MGGLGLQFVGRLPCLLQPHLVGSYKDLQGPQIEQQLVHVGEGHRAEWEDIFYHVFRAAWRQIRDRCSSMTEWMLFRERFERTLMQSWGLPMALLEVSQDTTPSPVK